MNARLLILLAALSLLLCVTITASPLSGALIGIQRPQICCWHRYATVIGDGDNSYHRGMQVLLSNLRGHEFMGFMYPKRKIGFPID